MYLLHTQDFSPWIMKYGNNLMSEEHSNKIASLQVLRVVVFMEIFLFHCGCSVMTGGFGVSIFIVMSGFLYGVKGAAPSIKHVFKNIMKLYPLHIICLLVGFVLLGWTVSKYSSL